MVMFRTTILIWKENKEGILGYDLSKSNIIRHELEGSTIPSVDNKDFLCEGHVFKTSSRYMVVGD
jgi:hypothetical protein